MYRCAGTNSITSHTETFRTEVEVALEDDVIQQRKTSEMKNPDSFTVHTKQLDSNT